MLDSFFDGVTLWLNTPWMGHAMSGKFHSCTLQLGHSMTGMTGASRSERDPSVTGSQYSTVTLVESLPGRVNPPLGHSVIQ